MSSMIRMRGVWDIKSIFLFIMLSIVIFNPKDGISEEIQIQCGGSIVVLTCTKSNDEGVCINSIVKIRHSSGVSKLISPRYKVSGVFPWGVSCGISGELSFLFISFTDCVACGYSKYIDIYTVRGDAMTTKGVHVDTIVDYLKISRKPEDRITFGR